MSRKSVLKLYAITKFFGNEPKLIERGENALESAHVKSYSYVPDNFMLKGIVEASQKDEAYEVEVSFLN